MGYVMPQDGVKIKTKTWLQTLITRSYGVFESKMKTRCKIFLFLFLIFRLSLSRGHFQTIKLLWKLLYTKYKSNLIRLTMVSITGLTTVSIVLCIIIAIILMKILFKMSSLIIYRHNQLKSLSWRDFSCVFNVGLRSLIYNASEIFRLRLLP